MDKLNEATDDPYFLQLVRFELSMRSKDRKVIHSYTQKRLVRLGDGISIALLKILDDSALRDGQTTRDILPLIQDSFSDPRLIANPADRKPRITLFLLRYLRQSAEDAQLKERIQETIEFVERTSAEGEDL